MASNWGPFLSYWGSYCKDALYTQVVRDEQSIHFSEGLLKTLCYETDVGPIPRGIQLNTSGNKPKYFHSENWNKKIQGCYWCLDDNTNIAGVCCNRDCFYYFHDWCVERVHHFTKRPFCRLPGCESLVISDSLYCNNTHEGKFDAAFPKGSDYNTLFKTVIREGPSWYRSNDNISHDSPSKPTDSRQSCPVTQSTTVHTNTTQPHYYKYKNTKKDNNQAKGTSTQVTPIMDFPTELHSAMIFKTDIGIIPRSPPREHHLTSPYSSSPNWSRDIKGCYWCGNKSDMVDANFCRYRCYLIFYEWCIRKVHTFTDVKICRDTGCGKTAADGFDCCNREHGKAIEGKYSSVKKVDLGKLCSNTIGPNFYKKCDVPNTTLNLGTKENLTHSQECVSTLTPQKTPTSLQSSTQPVSPKPLSVVLQESVSSIDSDTILLEPEKGVIHSLSHSYFNPFLDNILLESEKGVIPSISHSYFNPFLDNILLESEKGVIPSISPSYFNPFLNNILLESEKGVIPSISPSYYNPFLDNIPTQQEITSSHPTKSHTDIDTAATQTNLPELHPFTLSRKLTDLLAQHTDVGIIPRSKYQSAVPSPQYSNYINRSADITSCYWCELSNTSFHQLACGRKCWLLFHEWCVRKVESGCGFRLCVLPGCENSRATGCSCCSFEHIKRISELRGSLSPSTEEEVELTLGPKWYTDLSPVYFSRTGAFYEFSNYFPSLLLLDGCVWPTVYHYLCAQKLIGTPYSYQICGMECINELERWMKRRTLGKWVRPDWSRVCEGVTHKSVFTKFEQNKVLKGMLLRTGRRPLVCMDGSLGDMLVSLREWFRTYRYYPNQQTTKIHLTPSTDISEIVSKTSPPITDTKSLSGDKVVLTCEQQSSDDSDSNDEVADTVLASFDND